MKIWTRVWSFIFWSILYNSIGFLCLQTTEVYLKLNIINVNKKISEKLFQMVFVYVFIVIKMMFKYLYFTQ